MQDPIGDALNAKDSVTAALIRSVAHGEELNAHGRFHVECFDKDGNLKWVEDFDNIVTTVGKNDLLDKYLKGAAYTQTMRMGLKGVGVAVAGDTQASHATWLEVGLANLPTFTGNRQAITFNAASGGSSVSPAQSFAITGTGTVAGCFINNGGSATKDDTTGVLFSAGDFSLARSVLNGDTIAVTYTLTV